MGTGSAVEAIGRKPKKERGGGAGRGKGSGADETLREIRDRIVLEHLPLVKAIAIRVHETLPVHVDLDDLIDAGILGLFDAVSKYQPEKQVAFSSYAKHRIKGSILDSLRQLDWASRDLRRRQKQIEAASRELAATLQRNPTETELAERMGVNVERWRHIVAAMQCVSGMSISRRRQDQDDLPAPEYPADPQTHPEHICAHGQLHDLLWSAMEVLPERYRKVVVLYYTNDLTMREIGDMLGINESRVSQIHKSALAKMATALQASGIRSLEAF